MAGPDLIRPFNSVRTLTPVRAPREIVEAYALRQHPGQVISHTTALLLWGAPLPRSVETEEAIHVSSVGAARPRTAHTIPHRLYPQRTPVTMLGDIHLTSPEVSWVMSAPLLGLDALIAAGDFLVTGSEPYDGAPPLTTIDALAATVARRPGDRGIRRAREALEQVRYGSLSNGETRMRLMVVRAGLPEPELNYWVLGPLGDRVAMLDGAYPEFQQALEYESLLHQSPEKFRRDIRKQQELAAIDWNLHRLTSEEVDPRLRTPASRAAVARIRAALRARGWTPPR
ncbi:hypothetical protein D7I47_07720 [Protaetiibacter intestinalis]|uniref:Uncharacterized protein n=2 Tax=Protaetiibacter intestinalis TaxID=2419774 RepID=A0A387B8J8_9MICO|nr:hypothetical protein D7I47_07720 [Protaetiibacter intestinalis]